MGKCFFEKCSYAILCMFIILLSACTHMPAPPKWLAKIELNGPYDNELPQKYVAQLRGASITSDWGIPYIFMSVGLHYESTGDEVRSIHYFDRAIEEFRKRNNLYGEGTATSRKIFTLYEFGRIQDAFNLIKEKDKEWNTPPMKIFVNHNYGHYFLMNGDYTMALGYFKQAIDENHNYKDEFNLRVIRRDSELEYGISLILADYVSNMAKKYKLMEFDQTFYSAIRTKNIDDGIAHLNQVLVMNREIRKTKIGSYTPENVFQMMEANAFNFLGLADGIKGNWKDSHNYLEKASELAGKASFRIGEMDTLLFLNQVYILEKNINDGKKAAERLNEMGDKYHLPFYQIWAKYILSRYFLGFGNSQKAIEVLKEAAAIIEQQRSTLIIDKLKETYLFNRQVIYESLIYILSREGDFKGAMEMAERAKSRVMVDLLAGKDISRNKAEEELLKNEEEYSKDILKIKRQLVKTYNEEEIKEISSRLIKAEGGYRDLVIKVKNKNEELFSMISVQSLGSSEIQNMLDEDTTLVDYFVTDDLLYIWSVDKDRVHLERVKISSDELRNLVSSFISSISSKNREKTEGLSQRIYDIILKPIMPFVSRGRIGFIPHDFLYYLPIAALSNNGKYLVENYSIFYIPSATVFKYTMEKKGENGLKPLLAFGNPFLGDESLSLPYAEIEVERIQKRVENASVFLKLDATETKARELLNSYDIVHFATHGHFTEENPVNSSLLLAPGNGDDGRLSALEIFKLHFKGRAVILSACKTALGKSSTGSEIIGLNRSFLYAGSPSVVSTLWSIDDKVTADFMDDFYTQIEGGKGIAHSLKQAQVDMIKRKYEPYYWAPFILTGRY
ncbi:MAG: CHAT domain-containing protein [Desulfobacterales bacterium]|nr:CHAT domain-containing protein [Desulfobacterales bacterium]